MLWAFTHLKITLHISACPRNRSRARTYDVVAQLKCWRVAGRADAREPTHYGGVQWLMISKFETLFNIYRGSVFIKSWSHSIYMVCFYIWAFQLTTGCFIM